MEKGYTQVVAAECISCEIYDLRTALAKLSKVILKKKIKKK